MVAISAKIKTQTDEELKEELCRLHFTEICESTIEKTVDRGALERAALWAERYQDATKKGHAGFAVKGFSILRWGDTKRGEAFFSLPMSVTAGLLAASAGGGWTLMIAAGLAGQMMGYLVADMDRVKDNVKKEGAGNLKAFAACMRYAPAGLKRSAWWGAHALGALSFYPPVFAADKVLDWMGSMGIVGNIGWVDRLEKKIDGFDARVKEGNVALIKMRKSPKDAMAAYADAAECFRKLRRREGGYGARPDALHILKRMDAAGYPPSFKPEPDLPEFGELLRAGCSLNLAPLGKENPEEIHLLNAMKANAESLELVGSLVPAQSQYLAARKRMAL